MEIIDWEKEFEPLTNEKVDFILNLIENVKVLSENPEFGLEPRSVLEVAGHQMHVLLSMTLAGFDLYRSIAVLAEGLHDEATRLLEICKDLDVDSSLLESEIIKKYEIYMTQHG